MALFLVQHGLSLSKDEDPDRGLSGKGKEQTALIAGVAKNYSITVKRIVHSGKKRAVQTATVLQESLLPDNSIEEIKGINPKDDVRLFAESISNRDNLMVVGHMPFMEKLVSYLTTGSETNKIYKFQNSGIICLDQEDGKWFIKWTLNPNIS